MGALLKKYYPFAIIFLLVLFYAINNSIWLGLNEFPPFAGQAYHLSRGLDYTQVFRSLAGKDMLARALEIDNLRPPLFHLCLGIGNIICANPIVVYALTNILFIALLFLSVYFIGRRLYGKAAGILAVFILAMYPYVFGLSRMAKTNLASMALISAAIYWLLRADNFKRVIPSIFLGLFLGLAALARIQFIFFIIGPFIAAVIIAFCDQELIPIRKRLIFNLFLSIVTAILLVGFWYAPKFLFLLKTYSYYGFTPNFPSEFSPGIFSFQSLTFYLRGLVNGQITPFFCLFFLIGFLQLLKRKRLNAVLLSWIIISYIILTLIKSKEFRMASEYLPPFALITAGGILLLEKQWLRRSLAFIIILGGLLQYFLVSFTNPSYTRIKLSFFNGELTKGWKVSSYLYPLNEAYFHYPRRGDWQIKKIISTIQKESSVCGRNMIIGCTDAYLDVKTEWFDPFRLSTWHENFVAANSDALNYFIRARGLPYEVASLSYYQEDWRNTPILDFIVSVKEIKDIAPALSRKYELILIAEAPDKSPVYVYKKMPLSGKI